MCNKCDSSVPKACRGSRPWLLRSFVLLLTFAFVTVLLLGSSAHISFHPRAISLEKSLIDPPASRCPALSWQPPEDTDIWNLVLVNPWTPLPESYTVDLVSLGSGQAVDRRCAAALQNMLEACRAAGLSPLICSSYRTQNTQQGLYDAQVAEFLAQGCSREKAEELSATIVALPGTSEHQLGLAADIVDSNYQILESSQENTPVQRWLMEHCWEYGFILRYPENKTALTGIIYEPWHYRYVGRQAAQEIMRAGICLEEYVGIPSGSPSTP